MLEKLAQPTFAASATEELENRGHCSKLSRAEKENALAAIFCEMNKWSAAHLPMGATAEVSEAAINRGLHAVSNKFRNEPKLSESYGFADPVTLLTIISALFSIVGWIVKWWKGNQ